MMQFQSCRITDNYTVDELGGPDLTSTRPMAFSTTQFLIIIYSLKTVYLVEVVNIKSENYSQMQRSLHQRSLNTDLLPSLSTLRLSELTMFCNTTTVIILGHPLISDAGVRLKQQASGHRHNDIRGFCETD